MEKYVEKLWKNMSFFWVDMAGLVKCRMGGLGSYRLKKVYWCNHECHECFNNKTSSVLCDNMIRDTCRGE